MVNTLSQNKVKRLATLHKSVRLFLQSTRVAFTASRLSMHGHTLIRIVHSLCGTQHDTWCLSPPVGKCMHAYYAQNYTSMFQLPPHVLSAIRCTIVRISP
jgi:hypothetical protein